MPEDAWLLELEWITEEVIATYIECRQCGKKEIYWKNNREQGDFRGRRLEEAEWCGCPRQRRKEDNAVYSVQGKVQPDSVQSKPPKVTAREGDEQKEVRRTFKILKEVQLNIGIEKVDTHKGVTVKVLLDSGTTEMFMDRKMAARHRFGLHKLKRPVQVRNMGSTNNSVEVITHQVEVNMYYKNHIEKMRIDICNLGRTDVILGMPWLQAHNPEINWETGEI